MDEKIVIVGAGHAAGQVVASLRQKKHGGQIVLFGDEEHYPYQRPPLSKKFLAGELSAERLYVKPPAFYDHPDIDVRLSTRIAAINTSGKTVTDSAGRVTEYDRLVIATGARVRKLNLQGAELPGVCYLRNIQDVKAVQARMQKHARLVIIGGGYIGLEVAAVAAGAGLQVSVVEMAERVMSRVVAEPVSSFYEAEHRRHGVDLRLATGLSGFSGRESIEQVDLADGTAIDADLVLIGIGVVPNVELAESAGIHVDNGIRVDERCRTSVEDVYAVGDCTNHPNKLLGRQLRLESVHNALEQAKTAASNICGDALEYAQVPWFWSDQYDLKLQIAGISDGYDQTVIRGDTDSRSFSCLYLKEGRLIAIDSINAPRDFMQSKALIGNHAVIPADTLADTDVALKDMAY